MPAKRPRVGRPQNRLITPPSRFSCESDASSTRSEYGSPPQPHRGLAPPPNRGSARMPPIPGSPTDETEDSTDNISPVLSRGPQPPASRSLAPPSPPAAIIAPATMPETPPSPSDDVIPEEHRRVPGLIPRSPLSPIYGFMAKRAMRKVVPPPIVVVGPSSAKYERGVSPGLESVGIASPAAQQQPIKPKRKTMWGIIDGWWDLGLLERMNTVKRRK
ncbi:hypothetical protein B0T19DRAFT_295504 [Cercophora scortea]|uniref:Uncharacterized protein n=1 Tax=Cercophora scortea TaxID=314031 RepID=A0AAE0M3F9_9PEZI|nr:hypothetical protein B0T19DRAFT_295504 [Cercophora scortea]